MDFEEFKSFISEHLNDDPASLRLKYSHTAPEWNGFNAIDQIEARRRAKNKLPRFIACADTLFPSMLSSEQSTAEAVADYHASLIKDVESFADLTSGLGIDAFTIARKASHGTLFDRFPLYAEALSHNAKALGISNVDVICSDSIEYLRDHPELRFDLIFIDPARRDSAGRRTYSFADCEPDVVEHFPLLTSRCDTLMIKASPMLDIKSIIGQLDAPLDIHIVSLRGECKEVFVRCGKSIGESAIHCVNIPAEGEPSTFTVSENELGEPSGKCFSFCNSPLPCFLYEPNASVMKAAPWKALVNRFPALEKIARDAHLFLSDECYMDFPGRILSVVSEPDKKALKALKGKRINVVSRNYPLSADKAAASLGIIPGGEDFLYCFRDAKAKPRRLLTHPIDL